MIIKAIKVILIVSAALVASACSTTGMPHQPADELADDYVTWMRVAGLYPVSRIPVAMGFERWKHDYAEEVGDWSAEAVQIWSPALEGSKVPAAVLLHAPLLLIEDEVAADRFGLPHPSADNKSVKVDTAKPTVLWRQGTTQFKGRALDQISYILWFPERPKTGAFDLLGGPLDIVIIRVTLGPDGKPVLYDTIHGCGCYHLFFPVPPTRRKPMPEDKDMREAAFVPFEAPILADGERLGIRLTSGAHYVVGLEALRHGNGTPYALGDAETVTRTFAHLYDRNGILPQSKRLERFILWPMGIRSAGAMRAWGHHATAFVGKRQFNDVDLLDRAFE